MNTSNDSPRYLCNHCGNTFTLSADAEIRCPKCLRKSGLADTRTLEQLTTPPSRGRGRALLAVAALVAGCAGLWLAVIRPLVTEREVPTAPGDGAGALAEALAKAGAADAQVGFAATDRVRAFATGLGGSHSGHGGQSLLEAWESAHRAGKFAKEPLDASDMEAPPRTADALADLIASGKAPTLSAYEAVCLLYASAKALGLPLSPAVHTGSKNAGTALRRKAFGLVPTQGDPGFFDPYTGTTDQRDRARVLTDAELVGYGTALAGTFAMQEKRWGDAAKLTASAKKLVGQEPAISAQEGQIKVAQGMADLGIEDLAKAVSAAPDALGYYNLGMAYAMTESPFKAYQSIQRATELDPGLGDAWLGLANLRVQRLATVPKEEQEAAITEIQGFFDKAAACTPAPPGLGVSRAQFLVLQGKNDDAKSALEAVTKAEPEQWDAHLMLGELLLREDKAEAAVEHLERAARGYLERDPQNRNARELLNLGYATLGKWDRAVAMYEEIVEKAPNEQDVRLMLAGALREAGKAEEAKKVLEEQVTRFPKDALSPLLLAQLAIDAKDWPRAIELARKSRKAEDSLEGAVVEYLALFGAEQKDDALAVADGLAKTRANARGQMAQALLEQGQVDAAQFLLRKAIELEPTEMMPAVLLYMSHLALGEAEAAEKVRAEALGRAPAEKRAEWEKQFDESKQQVSPPPSQTPTPAAPEAPSEPPAGDAPTPP
jgi:tetratricopeptide (TPR) repeat protein